MSGEDLRVLAEEQAALRRVATLVARGTRPEEVFAAVVEEVGRLLPVDLASMCRYESDGTLTFVAAWGRAGEHFPVGSRRMLGENNLGTIVFETGRSARIDNYADSCSGTIGVTAREAGINSSLATPIMVEGRLWGLIAAGSIQKQPVPADTEARLASFTELVATAIANAESRAALAASRARIAAADAARRRIDELREISCGIHPAILSEAGLGPALRTLARRSAIPVELSGVIEHRLPEPIEVAAYYVVSEALTNTAKHANASQVDIEASARDGSLRLSIRDDGVGGADPAGGSGLVGLRDRVEVLGGSIEITSPPGHGTHLIVQFPLKLDLTVDSPPARQSRAGSVAASPRQRGRGRSRT